MMSIEYENQLYLKLYVKSMFEYNFYFLFFVFKIKILHKICKCLYKN